MACQRRRRRIIEPLNASERRKTCIIEHHHAPKCRNIRLVELPNASGRHSTRILDFPCVSPGWDITKHQRRAPPTMPAPSSAPAQPANISGIQGVKSSDLHILQSPSLHVSNSPISQFSKTFKSWNPRIPRPRNIQALKSPSFQILKKGAGGRGVAIQ